MKILDYTVKQQRQENYARRQRGRYYEVNRGFILDRKTGALVGRRAA